MTAGVTLEALAFSSKEAFPEVTAAEVEIKFEKEYAQTPLVNISVTLDDNLTDQEKALLKPGELKAKQDVQKALENNILNGDSRFIVTRRTTKGFVIKLNKTASDDLKFSWSALAIKDAKTAMSGPSVILGSKATPESDSGQARMTSSPSPSPTSLASSQPAIASSSAQVSKVITINNTELGFLRVRKEPSASSEELSQVNPGLQFKIRDETKAGGFNWYEIEYEAGKTGWVSSSYVIVKI